MIIDTNTINKRPAHNERFGASGAVPPQTNRTKNAKSYSAEKSWKPRLRQAAGRCRQAEGQCRRTQTEIQLTVECKLTATAQLDN